MKVEIKCHECKFSVRSESGPFCTNPLNGVIGVTTKAKPLSVLFYPAVPNWCKGAERREITEFRYVPIANKYNAELVDERDCEGCRFLFNLRVGKGLERHCSHPNLLGRNSRLHSFPYAPYWCEREKDGINVMLDNLHSKLNEANLEIINYQQMVNLYRKFIEALSDLLAHLSEEKNLNDDNYTKLLLYFDGEEYGKVNRNSQNC